MEAILFLTKKKGESKEGRDCVQLENIQRMAQRRYSKPVGHIGRATIGSSDRYQLRKGLMTLDIPNAFIQTEMPEVKDGEQRVTMKITGVLVDMIVQLNPNPYRGFVVCKKGQKVLCVQVMRAIYGMLVSFRKKMGGIWVQGQPIRPMYSKPDGK